MNGYIYLASPYSHPDPAVRIVRFQAACHAAAQLMEAGAAVFCPIAHSHPIAEAMNGKHTDHEFWMKQDLPLLHRADGICVLMLDGWLDSRGVQHEIDYALANNIPVKYIRP